MAGAQKITLESGAGLLDARALWASVVGPQRLAMAARKAVTLLNTEAVEVYKNLGASDAYVLVGIALPAEPGGLSSLQVILGKEDQLGFNAGWPVLVFPTGQPVYQVSQLLLPGEQLFAQIADPAVAQQNIVVAAVTF